MAPGTLLPFGEVETVCSVSRSEMGQAVDDRGGWLLFDTDPDTVSQRVMYISGFRDHCARMFSASLVLFGSAAAHETVRYSSDTAYSETDEAYEAIKARVCGVKRGSPCPADRIERLESKTSFVTAYPGFGAGSGPWLEMLLHDGKLEAVSMTKR